MSDEPENVKPEDETTSDAPAPESETAAEAQAGASASEADLASESEAPAPEATAEEPVAEAEAPAPPAPAAAPAPAAEPAEILAPKERRRRARTAKAAQVPTRGQTSPEDRQAERVAERSRKAKARSLRRKQEREKARSRRGTVPGAEPIAPRREQHPGQQKTRQGIVVSDRSSKTIVVRIDVARRHRAYAKVVRTSTTLHAHDEREDAHIGDTVVIREARPLSRTKRWRLVEVVARAK
jgi:small subunit ribosomal protein S17